MPQEETALQMHAPTPNSSNGPEARVRPMEFDPRTHADELVRRQRARPQAAFLSAAELQRRDPDAPLAPDAECADTLRTVQLVGGQRQQVDVPPAGVDRHLARSLRCVDVQ